MTSNDHAPRPTPRAAAFNTVANLLVTVTDAELRESLADAIIAYGAACAQQVLDS